MARLPSFFVSVLRTRGAITPAALDAGEMLALQVFAEQAVEALPAADYPDLVRCIALRIGREAVLRPVNSLRDFAETDAWLRGRAALPRRERRAVNTLQRALLKLGAQHPSHRVDEVLMQLPWGGDGFLGAATEAAIARFRALWDVPGDTLDATFAEALEAALAETPHLAHPDLSDIPRRAPARPLVVMQGLVGAPLPEHARVERLDGPVSAASLAELSDWAGWLDVTFHPRLSAEQRAVALPLGEATAPEARAPLARLLVALHGCDDPSGELALHAVHGADPAHLEALLEVFGFAADCLAPHEAIAFGA